jgi:choline dehydrogenase-like flavoprotein
MRAQPRARRDGVQGTSVALDFVATRVRACAMAGRMATETFDVCVIGTGAGGGVMIQELTAAGFRVVALQRGPFLKPGDFDDDELRTVIRDEVFSPNQVETYRFDEKSPTETGKFNMTADCVGGTITHWAGWSWRFRPDDFRVLSSDGPVSGASLADWPITYDELEPFYERAEWEFGVSGDATANPFGAPRKKGYPNPAHPGRASSARVAAGARKLGHHPFPTPMAINSQPYGARPECAYGGACQQYGCQIGAKATTLSVSLPKALATGKLDLRPNVMAREITVGADGRARSVRYLDEKRREHEVFARHVVVAGNAMGTPHLLLMSTSGSFRHGLANGSGLVGRNLTYHHFPAVNFTIDEPALSFAGVESHVALDDLHASDPKRGFIRGGVVADFNMLMKQPLAYAFMGFPGYPAKRRWGSDLKRYLRQFPRAVGLVGICEDLPMEDNRVDLDPKIKDRFGLPVPRITHRQHPNDLAMNRWYAKRLLELADAAGAVEKWAPQLEGISLTDERSAAKGSAHFHGTCRMGHDPTRSVVDEWCRSHEVPNLWIVDGSVFPTSAGYNPTLTILANAYRVADHFIGEAKRRSL